MYCRMARDDNQVPGGQQALMGASRLSRKDLCLIQMLVRRVAERQADID